MAKKKKNNNWFETFCMMDEAPSRPSASKNKKQERVRVQNRANAPYGRDEDIPPFDDTAGEPIRDDIFDGVKKPSSKSGTSRSGASKSGSQSRSSSVKSTSKSGARSSSAKGNSRAKEQDKPLPADIAYRLQPYLLLFFGGLLLIMLFLSVAVSGGSFDWTSQTHPFRWIGFHVENILFGLFGYGAFLLPLLMIYLSVMRLRDGKHYCSAGRGALALGIMILLPAMIHTCMIAAGAAEGALATFGIKALYSLGVAKLGGGVLGGLLGHLCYVGLGVVGTLIVGIVLLLVLIMLFLGITPANIRLWWCACREARQERLDREAYEREQEEKQQRKLEAAERRAQLKARRAEESEEDDVALLPAPGRKKAGRDRDDLRDRALEEAERSDRREGRAVRKMPVEDDEEDAPYLDPMEALLAGGKKKKKESKQEKLLAEDDWDIAPPAEDDYTPETVFPDFDRNDDRALEYVSDLKIEEIDEDEEPFSPIASRLPSEYESDEGAEGDTLRDYPGRVEIELDETTPLPPVPEEQPAEPEQTEDYQGGFDYSMESTDDAELDGGEEVKTVGGVEIKIDKLSREERERGEKIADEEEEEYQPRPYTYPRVDLLNEPKPHNALKDQEIRAKMQKLNATLTNFKVRVDGISYVCGPSVTRYEVRPAPGVRVRSIANLADDIAMSLAAKSIRIEAPIPGKEAVGIEVPNTTRETVFLRRLIDSDEFRGRPSKLTACLGEDVAGNPIVFDIVKMPHLLVAGTTGSGKSVCINDFIMSLVYKSTPQEVKIILIDPKQVEFTVYKDLPHLMAPIVCDPKRAAAVLNLAVLEMEKRFQMIRDVQARNIEGYNAATENDRYEHPYMPHIVIIIDELADLMMQAKEEVETSIVRLAQKARAAGMHLIIGTQRPSVDVITGLIKANVPSRIACTVVSQVDSRTILDVAGAEKLLGMGDMLYAPVGSPKPLRVQGAFVSDGEVERIVEFIKRNNDPVRYDQEFMDNIDREAAMIGTKRQPGAMDDDDDGESPDGMDPKFYEALRIALDNKRISTSLLQRMLSIGYGRAAKIIDQMERMGFVGPAVGNKPREIRITEQGYAELMMNKDQ